MSSSSADSVRALPVWFHQELPDPDVLERMRRVLRPAGLHTVCEGAGCPNLGKCWKQGAATFMILGNVCTRACRFCAVSTGRPSPRDPHEPQAIARAAEHLGLRYVVVTSVTRDDLADGGAGQFADTIRAIKAAIPSVRVEVLIPDLLGRQDLIKVILDAKPDVIGHNIETVRRLSRIMRPQSDYGRSLNVLHVMRDVASSDTVTKSGLMVGLGESDEEVLETLKDLSSAHCDVVTIGQYLAPSREERHFPVSRFVPPERFEDYRRSGTGFGIGLVVAGPLVRSSYLAEQVFEGSIFSRGKH